MPSLPPDVPNRPLSADEAVRIALRLQPNIAIARANLLAAQGRTQQARSGLLPTLGLSGSYNSVSSLNGSGTSAVTGGSGTGSGSSGAGTGGGTGSTGGTGGTSSLQASGFLASATVRQLIFDFNHTRDLVREAASLERAANQNLTRTQYDLILQAKQAYYAYAQNLRLVTVNESNVANRQAQLALAQARLNTGLGLPSDVATAQTAVAEAIANLTIARNNADVARINLALTMGVDPRTPLQIAPTDEAPFPSNDVNGLVATALRQRPEVLQAQATIQANQSGLNAARTTNAPSVSGSFGFTTRGDQVLPQNDTFAVGISVSFSPFDGGLTAGRVKEARANLTASQAQLLATQQSVTSDVAQAYVTLRTAEQRVAVATNEVANATEGVRIVEGRYRSGLGLFLDIINAQAQLLTAQTNLVNAQAAVSSARAAINRAIGSPLPPGR